MISTPHIRKMLAKAGLYAKLAEEWDQDHPSPDQRDQVCRRHGIPHYATPVMLLERAATLARHAAAELADEQDTQQGWVAVL